MTFSNTTPSFITFIKGSPHGAFTEQERRLAAFLDRESAGWPKPTIALDRLPAAMAQVDRPA